MLDRLFSRVAHVLGLEQGHGAAVPPWSHFSALTDANRPSISPDDLVDIAAYRKQERMAACGGRDPLQALPAYAQDTLAYDAEARLIAYDKAAYETLPVEVKLNKFGQAYRSEMPLLMHRALADIMVDAAVDMQQRYGWSTTVFDGLRTVDSTYLLYRSADPKWLADGLLAKPGDSAHNRALAVDSMMFDGAGREVNMGGHFDHLDMKTNHRNYNGDAISQTAKHNRILREQSFQRAAIKNGRAFAPLRAEFWDDRMPGTEKDLWRVIESLARATGQQQPAEAERAVDYEMFAAQWRGLNRDNALVNMFGEKAAEPPVYETIIFHEKLNPIYDRDLPQALRQAVMDPARLSGPLQKNL